MMLRSLCISTFFFFNDTATTEIYTLSLHDALPICHVVARRGRHDRVHVARQAVEMRRHDGTRVRGDRALERRRSEEHTSELQSRSDLVCRLLLEKKKTISRTSLPTYRARLRSVNPF